MFTPFYRKWWKELDLVPLEESKANCASCTMVKPPQNETLRDPGPFDEKLKCCTYFPFVPNFSVGSLSASRSLSLSPTSTVLSKAVADGFLSPLGLFPKKPQERTRKGFGTDLQQRCPFLSDSEKSCTIWNSRPSVCASYFCVSSKGADGLNYWSKAEELGNQIEWTIAHEVLWSLGLTTDETDEMFNALEARDEKRIANSWLEWRGSEMELYAKCLEVSEQITAVQLKESLGPRGETLIQELLVL